MKKVFCFIFTAFICFFMAGCSSSKEYNFQSVIDKLKGEGIPIVYSNVYTPENGLGSDDFLEKGSFSDSRIEKEYNENNPLSGSVEIFNNEEEARERAIFLKGLSAVDDLGNHIVKDNVLIRLNKNSSDEVIESYVKAMDGTLVTKVEKPSQDSTTETKKEPVKEKAKFMLFDYFFDNDLRWNMNYEEGTDTIPLDKKDSTHSFAPGNKINPALGSLTFYGHETSEVQFSDKYVFLFPNDKFKTYWVSFDDKALNENKNYLELYDAVKQEVISRYGDPTTEDFNWSDDAYKANEEDWPKGFKYGYLTIETQWLYAEEIDIVMRWDYKNGLLLIICEKGYIPNL